VSNCREDDSMLLSPYREKKSLTVGWFLKAIPISSAGTVEFI